jgi:DnaJ-class molecular chaperone
VEFVKIKPCPECNGRGYQFVKKGSGPFNSAKCGHCGGLGIVPYED